MFSFSLISKYFLISLVIPSLIHWLFKSMLFRGTWVAQSVKLLSLDLSSGLDFRVVSSSPTSGSMLSGESA